MKIEYIDSLTVIRAIAQSNAIQLASERHLVITILTRSLSAK